MTWCVLLAVSVLQAGQPPPDARRSQGPILVAEEVFQGTITAIEDGDTLVVKTATERLTIHLEGIDAPEMSQPGGLEAKTALGELTLGKTVTVRLKSFIDRVARVELNGADVSAALIRRGMAWHCPRYTTDRDLTRAEEEARASRRGLWSAARPTPPWLHRRAGSCWEETRRGRAADPGRPDFSGMWRALTPADRAGQQVAITQDAVRVTIEHRSGEDVESVAYNLNGPTSLALTTPDGPADLVAKTRWSGGSLIVEERYWPVHGEEAKNRRRILWLDDRGLLNMEVSTARPIGENDTMKMVLQRVAPRQ